MVKQELEKKGERILSKIILAQRAVLQKIMHIKKLRNVRKRVQFAKFVKKTKFH